MVEGETHAFGVSSLDLTNHYYGGSEADAEKLRFVQYCQDTLGQSAVDGNVSSPSFLGVLQKYCYYRNMRGNVCRAAESLAFRSLPQDVQLAFVNELCSGPRENRLPCLDDLFQKDDVILVPESWKYGICCTTYPLVVSYDTSAASFEEHAFSTQLGQGSTTNQGSGSHHQSSTTSQVIFEKSAHKKTTKNENQDAPQVFQKSYSQQLPPDEPAPQTLLTTHSLPTTAASEPSRKGNKGKKKDSSVPTMKKTTYPSIHYADPPTQSPSSLAPTITPKSSDIEDPTAFLAEESSTAPTMAPFESILTTSPTWKNDYVSHSVMDSSSIVPREPLRSRTDDGSSNSVDWAGASILFIGILFVPVLFFLFAKVYQRRSQRPDRDPALLEDFSVVSENSEILVAMGSKFKRSDEYSVSDIESNESSFFVVGQAKGIAVRVLQAFNRMYEYIDEDSRESQQSRVFEESTVEPPPKQPPPSPSVRVSSSKSDFEVFRPSQSPFDETIGISKIDPGTVLLPADDVYINEFSFDNVDTCEGPIIYHRSEPMNKKVSFQSAHPGAIPAADEPRESLATPVPFSRGSKSAPTTITRETIAPTDSCTSDSTRAINVDVLREDKSDNTFRIVGLAFDSYPSDETEEDDSTANSLFQQEKYEEEQLQRRYSYKIPLKEPVSNPRQMISPGTFEQLSRELDGLVAGERQVKTQRQSSSESRRKISAAYKFDPAISSLTNETTSTLSDNTPIVGHRSKWPSNPEILDALCEPSSIASDRGGSQVEGYSKSCDAWDIIGRLSIAASPSNSSRGEDGMETMLADDGGVTVKSSRSAAHFLRKIT